MQWKINRSCKQPSCQSHAAPINTGGKKRSPERGENKRILHGAETETEEKTSRE